MEKPEAITKLEIQLNIQIKEVKAIKEFKPYPNNCCFTLNEQGEVTELRLTLIQLMTLDWVNYFNNLNFLDVSNNKISEINSLGTLTLIKELNLSGNQITEISAIEKLQTLKELRLDRNQISNLTSLEKLDSLTNLNVSFNKISDISIIAFLKNLEDFDITSNQVIDISILENLVNLRRLSLGNNPISNIDVFSKLPILEDLDLGDMPITNFKPLATLSQLKSFRIFNSDWPDLHFIASNIHLTSLIIRNSRKILDISDLGNFPSLVFLIIMNTEISGATSLETLTNLETLMLMGNQLIDIDFLSASNNLKNLYLLNNKIKDITALKRHQNLRYLDLSSNNISNISPLENLDKLETLFLSGNQIEDISPIAPLIEKGISISSETPNQKGIEIENNPVNTPPLEVIEQGNEAVKRFFKDAKKSGLKPLNECKLIFVGDGAVGKTSLMKLIAFNDFKEGENTTHGINKIAWHGLENSKGEKIRINLWDFGGQHIQHSMHQFFFTERVVYILVLNPRNDEKAAYWLEQIDKLGSGSEILIVYNWKEENDKKANYLTNFYELRKKYSQLREPFLLSCMTREGLDIFINALEKTILEKKELKDNYPSTWFNIKKTVEDNIPIRRNYITYEKYQELCIENNYTHEQDQKSLLITLDRIGSIVFFNRPILNQLQVLNPEWITTGAYAILTSEITKDKNGHLTFSDLKKIFKDAKEIFADKEICIKYTEQQFQFIIQLLLEYSLCQANPLNKNEYLIPSAFKGKPEKDYSEHIEDSREYRIQFDAPFEMLIMHRFIAKNINKIVGDDYWQSGIFIKDTNSETYALVETNLYSSRIDFWIKGNNIRGFWEALRRDLKEIFGLYKKFEYNEEVLYRSENKEVFLPYQEMLDSLRNGISVIPYHPTYQIKNIDVLQIIDLFEDASKVGNDILKESSMSAEKINVVFNNNPSFRQNNENKNVNSINIKIDVTKIPEYESIKDLLLDLKEANVKNAEWQKTIVSCLDELNRLEIVEDKAAQKTSLDLIKRGFKKLKDLKDIITIGLLPVDIAKKIPELLVLWDAFKNHFNYSV